LILDCLPTGERTWYVRYQVGHGEKRKERFYRLGSFDAGSDDFLTLGQAIDRANDIRVDAKKHKRDRFAEERAAPTGLTFGQLVKRWIDRHGKPNKKSWREDEALYKRHIENRLGDRIVPLSRRDVIGALDDIADNVSGKQANASQAVISAALNWGVDEDIIESNPARGIRKRAKEVQRERILNDAELRSFWLELTDGAHDRAIRLLLLLGQRRSEVCYANESELTTNTWSLPGDRTKNALPHIVPLTPYARSLFGDGFNIYPTTLSHRVLELARELGIDDFRLHDLRHQAATGMAALGISREIRERVQNQITGRRQTVGARYDQHEYLAEKRDALARWERELLRIVS
jgi:integrase